MKMRHALGQNCSGFRIVVPADGFILSILLGWLLAACQPVQPVRSITQPISVAGIAASQGGELYVVDPDASGIRLLVYRDGPLARLGHNHVMTGRVRGEIRVAETATASRFSIEIPLESFEVDLPLPRSEEGAEFAAEVSDGARQGTRKNMLGADLLDASNYPVIHIESIAMSGNRLTPDVTARITLRGVSSELKFQAVVLEQPGAMKITASFRVLQTDLGLQPFSILGGAISVRDAIDIRVKLLARSVQK